MDPAKVADPDDTVAPEASGAPEVSAEVKSAARPEVKVEPKLMAKFENQAESQPDLKLTSPETPPGKSESKTGSKLAKSGQRFSNIIVGLVLIVGGAILVALVTLFTPTPTPDQNVPYLLEPVEKHLDANLRYKSADSLENKDWRHDLIVEQAIWTNEISKMMLGRPDAKPIENKRDFLLFLADSYFKDEPHFSEAKAAYLAANATPRVPHAKAYDYSDAELARRIGYCDLRLGFYDEAESWLKKALVNIEADKNLKTDLSVMGCRDRILDNLTENYARMGQSKQAEEYLNRRLTAIHLKDVEDSVESPLLYNAALIKEQMGDFKAADALFVKAIERCIVDDDRHTPIVPESLQDNSRSLARILMTYSHLLRKMHRNPEAIATMRRALVIYDNPL
ncbi:MAG: tetratricopeptide repeat protein [Cyanobacteria bacterium REEB67]|nr:tetratricopeptide repeat protein [Cyanobacteria bacterium REEB67]